MATITEADVQAWLERQADHWMKAGEFTSDIVPGVTQYSVGLELDDLTLFAARLDGKVEIGALAFHATWLGVKLTTKRQLPTREDNSKRQVSP